MIVSFEHGFVFVKGVKVGGSSVELHLSQTLDDHAIVAPALSGNAAFRPRNFRDERSGRALTNHASAAEAQAFLGQHVFAGMRRALIVRNPFEKVRSWFYFKLASGVADLTVDDAIAGCTSEVVRAHDGTGRNLLTDTLFYERLDDDLAAFFAAVGVPFAGRLAIFEKAWQRQRYRHLRVRFSPDQEAAVRAKFVFEFECYAKAGLTGWLDPSDDEHAASAGPGVSTGHVKD